MKSHPPVVCQKQNIKAKLKQNKQTNNNNKKPGKLHTSIENSSEHFIAGHRIRVKTDQLKKKSKTQSK